MKNLLHFFFVLCLSACAGSVKGTYPIPSGLADLASANQLACRYEKQVVDASKPQKTSWYFWRQKERTETRDELSNQGEIWEKNNSEALFYTRLFYNEKVALEFVQGDLAATSVTPSLQQLTSLVDPKMLGKELTLLSKGNRDGTPIEYYQGTINNVVTEVDWLPFLQLPARLVKKLPDGTLSLTLAECGQGSKFDVQPITKAELDNFRRLDYTDLGDMEDDPMVQHIEHLIGGHHKGHQ
jgi:hypothetical protein